MNLLQETWLQIIRTWRNTIAEASRLNNLSPELIASYGEERILKEPLFCIGEIESEILSEVWYKGQLIARLSRTGFCYQTQAFLLRENATFLNEQSS